MLVLARYEVGNHFGGNRSAYVDIKMEYYEWGKLGCGKLLMMMRRRIGLVYRCGDADDDTRGLCVWRWGHLMSLVEDETPGRFI